MSALFHGERPRNPGTTYAMHSNNNAQRGNGRTASCVTMAGVGWFTRQWQQEQPQRIRVKTMKKAARLPELPLREHTRSGLLRCSLAETVAEALDATTHVVHRLLRAGVEGVRLGRCVEFELGYSLPSKVSLSFVFTHARVKNLKPLEGSTNRPSR